MVCGVAVEVALGGRLLCSFTGSSLVSRCRSGT